MNERTTLDSQEHGAGTDFWSDIYSGRSIAILNHYGRLHVYLDHILQHGVVFAERRDAIAWLMEQINQAIPAVKPKRSGGSCS